MSLRKIIVTTLSVLMPGLTVLGSQFVQAHELQENRLTLVQRENRHVSLQFYVDFLSMLKAVADPNLASDEFAKKYAAAPPSIMASLLRSSEDRWQKAIILTSGKTTLSIRNWRWPNAEQVQRALQERVMHRIVAPHEHAAPVVLEVSADGLSSTNLKTLKLQLPPEMYPLLVVSYRPRQTWLSEGEVMSIHLR